MITKTTNLFNFLLLSATFLGIESAEARDKYFCPNGISKHPDNPWHLLGEPCSYNYCSLCYKDHLQQNPRTQQIARVMCPEIRMCEQCGKYHHKKQDCQKIQNYFSPLRPKNNFPNMEGQTYFGSFPNDNPNTANFGTNNNKFIPTNDLVFGQQCSYYPNGTATIISDQQQQNFNQHFVNPEILPPNPYTSNKEPKTQSNLNSKFSTQAQTKALEGLRVTAYEKRLLDLNSILSKALDRKLDYAQRKAHIDGLIYGANRTIQQINSVLSGQDNYAFVEDLFKISSEVYNLLENIQKVKGYEEQLQMLIAKLNKIDVTTSPEILSQAKEMVNQITSLNFNDTRFLEWHKDIKQQASDIYDTVNKHHNHLGYYGPDW